MEPRDPTLQLKECDHVGSRPEHIEVINVPSVPSARCPLVLGAFTELASSVLGAP